MKTYVHQQISSEPRASMTKLHKKLVKKSNIKQVTRLAA